MAASVLDIDGIYNVGTGVETSVNQLYAELVKALGSDMKPEHGPAKAGEQMRSVLDASKLRNAAQLPQFTRFSDGVRRTVEWLQSVR